MSAGDRAALTVLAVVIFAVVTGTAMVLFIGTVIVGAVASAFNA